ncbi:hypothetical protein BAE42_29240 [Mesorhizobium loti]|nr:hypothetical protein BAE42_29240 [Mesorhizobium loti]OBP85585.1 hypothetical protein BAE41_27040 [Mesorhizobium loti]OBP96935.1 hypothetical protein BAE38_26965 [Mesorhizobium loti]OBQ68076.1 hypothetical protein A8146_11860 [Mesorhizobium loti]OBQ73513.1 hypothetical protein A9K72_30865 [Mesorhizobium loti]
MGAGKIEVSSHQRRTTQCGENPAKLGWLAGDGLADSSAQARGIRSIFGQAASQRSNEVAIGIAAKHLEARQAALAEARSIVLNGAFLRAAHSYLRLISSNITRMLGLIKVQAVRAVRSFG